MRKLADGEYVLVYSYTGKETWIDRQGNLRDVPRKTRSAKGRKGMLLGSGKRLLYARNEGAIKVLDTGGEVVDKVPTFRGPYIVPLPTSGGACVVFDMMMSSVPGKTFDYVIFDREGRVRHRRSIPVSDYPPLAESPDGKFLVFSSGPELVLLRGNEELWSISTKGMLKMRGGVGVSEAGDAFMMRCNWDYKQRHLYLYSVGGQEIINEELEKPYWCEISPSGRYLAFYNEKELKIRDLKEGGMDQEVELPAVDRNMSRICFLGDNTIILTSILRGGKLMVRLVENRAMSR